jgi:hypothetical protein
MGESEVRPYLSSLLYIVVWRRVDIASVEFARKFKAAHAPEDFPKFISSLEWASANPAYQFDLLLPGVQMPNEEIRQAFSQMLAALRAA